MTKNLKSRTVCEIHSMTVVQDFTERRQRIVHNAMRERQKDKKQDMHKLCLILSLTLLEMKTIISIRVYQAMVLCKAFIIY
jgi:hypothetical protein